MIVGDQVATNPTEQFVRRPGGLERLLGDLMVAFGGPINMVLGGALRRLARRDPEAFDRLGEFGRMAFLIAPTELPVAFRLEPSRVGGRVNVVSRSDPTPVAAKIKGPLADLLELFDGTRDADAAFFSRGIDVQGDTNAAVALHNALEAADLTLADLLGAPAFLHAPLNRGIAFGLREVLPRLGLRGP